MANVNEMRQNLSQSKRIVVKIGTDCLTREDSKLDESSVEKLVSDIVNLLEMDKEIVLVSSGAIGAGIGRLSLEKRPEKMESLQAASTIGQSALMRKYSESFEENGKHIAQLLLTREDFTDPNRFENFKSTINRLFTWNVLPIINENDAVAVEEIRMGDNDLLSAFTATGTMADLLVILTDVDGLYTKDPKKSNDAESIKNVEKVTPELEKMIEKTSGSDFGGMFTKIKAAKMATEDGVPVVVTDAKKKNVLERIL